ncbi:hypothetical protein AURDEDRAFT_111968 [Auricularia subglabra TFB-10046 SS5]|nr:hypothetical protein AURDEDRAFT_111968 [Auricularia subglabra TFB-10046 SS5]
MTIARSAEGVLIWLASLAAIISCVVAVVDYYRRHDAAVRRASSGRRAMVSTDRRGITHPLDLEILGEEGVSIQAPARAHLWRPFSATAPSLPPAYERV